MASAERNRTLEEKAMADTDDTQTDPEQQPAAEEQPAAEQQPAAEEQPAAGEQPDAGEQPPAEEQAEAAPQPAAVAAPAEPVEQLTPKQRRQRRRVLRAAPAAAPRTPEERHAGRVEERRAKAAARRRRRLQERAKASERRGAAPAPDSAQLAPVHPEKQGVRRVRQGVVVSDKAEKTITVRIDVARRHRRYEKIVRSSSTVHAHDENNEAHEGDVVRVIESRPLSRTKRWSLIDVLERAR